MTMQLLRDDRRLYLENVQRPADALAYGTDWTERNANLWQPNTQFAANAAIRPNPSTGYQYSTVLGGLTGKSPPFWPVVIGATVQDGSITWVCAAIDTTSLLRTPATQTWTVDSGLAVSASSLSGNITQATIDTTGATSGTDYYARNQVTFSDATKETAVFLIKVRSGNT